MSDIDVLKELVQSMAVCMDDQNTKASEQIARITEENAKLIIALQNQGQQPPNQPQDAAAIRADKFLKLVLALRKSGKVKDFKEGQETTIEDWMKRFNQEILQLKKCVT